MVEDTFEASSRKKPSLNAIASKVREEVFLDSQLQVAGSNEARVLSRLEKNKNDSKKQATAQKIVYAILLGVLPVMPLFMYVEVSGLLAGGFPFTGAITLVSVLLLVLYIAMVSLYVLILGVMNVSGFMAGECFQWLEVLPISRRDVQRVSFLVLWRIFDIPVIVIVVAFPVLMGFASGSLLVLLTCMVVSASTGFFLFCVTVLVAEKFTRLLKGDGTNSRKANIVRSIAMLGYIIAMLSTGLGINISYQAIGPLFANLGSLVGVDAINVILGFIPFPFAPCFLITFAFMPPGTVPIPLVASTITGCVLFGVIAWLLFRHVLGKLANLTTYQARTAPARDRPVVPTAAMRAIVPLSPVRAYVRKDLAALTRDFQGAIYLFMPLIYPFVIFLPGLQGVNAMPGLLELYVYLLIFAAMLVVMDAGMLVSGLLGMEDSGSSIMASLPVVPRDQVIAKLRVMCPLQVASVVIPLLFLAGHPAFPSLALFFTGLGLASLATLLFTFAAKVRLFGKLAHKHVVEEVNVERKVLKWATIIGMDIGIVVGMFLLVLVVGSVAGPHVVTYVMIAAGGAGVGVMLLMLHRMFPRPRPRASPIP